MRIVFATWNALKCKLVVDIWTPWGVMVAMQNFEIHTRGTLDLFNCGSKATAGTNLASTATPNFETFCSLLHVKRIIQIEKSMWIALAYAKTP